MPPRPPWSQAGRWIGHGDAALRTLATQLRQFVLCKNVDSGPGALRNSATRRFFPSKRRHGSRIRGTLMCSAPGGIRLALSKGKHGLAEDCRAVGVHVGTAAQLRSIPTGAVRGGGVFGAARGADAAALAP